MLLPKLARWLWCRHCCWLLPPPCAPLLLRRVWQFSLELALSLAWLGSDRVESPLAPLTEMGARPRFLISRL